MSLAEQDAIARNTPEALIDRLGMAMRDLTAAVQHNTNSNLSVVAELEAIGETLIRIEQKLATSSEARSSVEIATSTRGYDIKAKAYQGSPITEAGNAALDEYLRVREEIERRLTNGGKA